MLVRETDGNELMLAQATPRRWLEPGKKIIVRQAPTRFGPVSMTIQSEPTGAITAEIDAPQRSRPAALVLRIRQPDGKRMKTVVVNGGAWSDFDTAKEWVRISTPRERRYSIRVTY